ALASLAVVLVASGCEDDEHNGVGPEDRVFNQIERLGNPLVSEVTFAKRDHGLHNSTAPEDDIERGFRTRVEAFVNTFRPNARVGDQSLAQVLSSVLIPDVLVVQTDKLGSSAGWLTWALADGYGGRKLTDDVVSAGLGAIFGTLLSEDDPIPGLADDNVPANDVPFLGTFPYLANPH
ncbi:MAG: DUF4331 domain-containing protein, partial [Chloroflexota bacterium]|nr:DUF4331 domain-containing protein [Chloroflexota bacterium]